MATAEDLKHLRRKSLETHDVNQFLGHLVRFLASTSLPIFRKRPRCTGFRDFDLITVSANMPDEKDGVMRMLEKKHATSRNLLFASTDTAASAVGLRPVLGVRGSLRFLLAPTARSSTKIGQRGHSRMRDLARVGLSAHHTAIVSGGLGKRRCGISNAQQVVGKKYSPALGGSMSKSDLIYLVRSATSLALIADRNAVWALRIENGRRPTSRMSTLPKFL